MKKIFFVLMALIVGLTFSCNQSNKNNSQQNSGPGGGMGPGNFDPKAMAERQVEDMKKMIDLNSEQEVKMHDIILGSFENMTKMREEMQDNGGDFEGNREKMQKMFEEQNQKIKEILTEEQWVKYEAFQKERRSKRGHGQGAPGGQNKNS